jgi:type IV pilus assembly protein PilP
MKLLPVYIVAAAVIFSAAGCEKEEPAPTVAPKRPEAAKPAERPEAAAPVPAEPVAVEKMRNPFQSYLAKERVRPARVKTPLEEYETASLKLMAVISNVADPVALIQTPDGKRYVVKRGDRVGVKEGRIVAISATSIVVQEEEVDEEGNVSRPMVTLALPKDEKGELPKSR